MKRFTLLSFSALLGIMMCACHNDDDDEIIPPAPVPEVEGRLLDGGTISDIGLYCIENDDAAMIGQNWVDYYAKTKTVKDYSDFKLYILLNQNASIYTTNDLNEMSAISQQEIAYEKEKSAFMLEDYLNYAEHAKYGWPNFLTAYLNGEVTVTCDKSLYGETPGENLSKYFTVTTENVCLPVGKESATLLYKFGDELPTEMPLYFVDGSWLQPEYHLQFAVRPTIKPDQITLNVSIPMTIEHERDYVVAQLKGIEASPMYTDTVFRAECLIKFDWH